MVSYSSVGCGGGGGGWGGGGGALFCVLYQGQSSLCGTCQKWNMTPLKTKNVMLAVTKLPRPSPTLQSQRLGSPLPATVGTQAEHPHQGHQRQPAAGRAGQDSQVAAGTWWMRLKSGAGHWTLGRCPRHLQVTFKFPLHKAAFRHQHFKRLL